MPSLGIALVIAGITALWFYNCTVELQVENRRLKRSHQRITQAVTRNGYGITQVEFAKILKEENVNRRRMSVPRTEGCDDLVTPIIIP